MAPPAATQPSPQLNIPASSATVTVSILDSTLSLAKVPSASFFQPVIPGNEYIGGPAHVFLIEHTAGAAADTVAHDGDGQSQSQSPSPGTPTTTTKRRFLFDLSMRKDWENLAPHLVKNIRDSGWEIQVRKNVAEVLEEEGGVDLESIEGIVLSTDLIVGPGFKDALFPGYPANPEASILESDYSGRTVKEINFDKDEKALKLGRFNAVDFFGDGSFYLIDSPGHAPGHLCGLARTTPDTFILMGGDIVHHGGEFRPSAYIPLPDSILPNPLDLQSPSACPGHVFEAIHPAKSRTQPFLHVATGDDGGSKIALDPAANQHSVEKLEEFDAWPENVFVVFAHDRENCVFKTLLDIIDFFPHATANAWREKGWANQGRWRFLSDFKPAVEQAQAQAQVQA
ncbi:MAG: hypothetical protein M1837_001791 [Sclerophora amabilis]|nr:MAG: hypothetical protein M1837_001791 [Sclerophora amabilis]